MRTFSGPGTRLPVQFAIIASLALAAGCSKALAQGQSWQCATPNGTYNHKALTIPPNVHALTGEVRFKGEFGAQWNPIAHIAFTSSKFPASGGECYCNGLLGEMRPDSPGIVVLSLMANGNHSEIARADAGQPIPFRISVNDGGMISVEVGGASPGMESAQLVHEQRDTVHMSCSSGDFTFSNLRTE